MKEQDIIQGCCNGDRRSQNILYEKYYPLMSSIALRYCDSREAAESGLNYGFLKVLQNIEKYNDEFALATWIRKILVNHFIDEFRKTQKHISTIHIGIEDQNEALVDYNSAELEMDADYVRSILLELPEVTNKVFNLFAIDGYKHKEIAQLLNIPEGTSKCHVSRARNILKEKIKNRDIDMPNSERVKNIKVDLKASLL